MGLGLNKIWGHYFILIQQNTYFPKHASSMTVFCFLYYKRYDPCERGSTRSREVPPLKKHSTSTNTSTPPLPIEDSPTLAALCGCLPFPCGNPQPPKHYCKGKAVAHPPFLGLHLASWSPSQLPKHPAHRAPSNPKERRVLWCRATSVLPFGSQDMDSPTSWSSPGREALNCLVC